MSSLTSSLSEILVNTSAAQAHQELVHFVHHAHVSLVEESRIATSVYALHLRTGASSKEALRLAWYLAGSDNVTSCNARGEVQVERNSEVAGWLTEPLVGLDGRLERIG